MSTRKLTGTDHMSRTAGVSTALASLEPNTVKSEIRDEVPAPHLAARCPTTLVDEYRSASVWGWAGRMQRNGVADATGVLLLHFDSEDRLMRVEQMRQP